MYKIQFINYDDYQFSSSAFFTTSSTVCESSLNQDESVARNNQFTDEYGKYHIIDIANWLLNKESMTHKKLQKLCYYVQAWNYTLRNTKLIDTCFEAWVHGPVSPVLYEHFKGFGYNTIKISGKYISRIDEEDEELLERVWETYGEYTGNALESLTHTEEPWIKARSGCAPMEKCQVVIELDYMKQYYETIYEK